MGIFKQVQEKDSVAKTQFSLLAAGVVTGLIALVWVSTLPARIGDTITLGKQEESLKENANEEGEGGIGSLIGETKNQLGSLVEWKDALNEETTTASEAESGALMDMIPVEDEESSALDSFVMSTTSEATSTPIDSAPSLATTTPTEVLPVEPTPPPKIILIGTSTRQNPQ